MNLRSSYFSCTIQSRMILSPAFLRVCLVLCLVGMALIAALYLRGRKLNWWEYLAWGLFMLLDPYPGTFPNDPLQTWHPAPLAPLPQLFH